MVPNDKNRRRAGRCPAFLPLQGSSIAWEQPLRRPSLVLSPNVSRIVVGHKERLLLRNIGPMQSQMGRYGPSVHFVCNGTTDFVGYWRMYSMDLPPVHWCGDYPVHRFTWIYCMCILHLFSSSIPVSSFLHRGGLHKCSCPNEWMIESEQVGKESSSTRSCCFYELVHAHLYIVPFCH